MWRMIFVGHSTDCRALAAPVAHALTMLALGLMFAFAPLAAQAAPEDRRLALVVGNSDYAHLDPLPNGTRDARDIAAALRAYGFEVTLLLDGTHAEFTETITQFAATVDGAEAALFYFSGHGFQKSGVNYLAPVDARLDTAAAIASQTVRLDDVTDQISAPALHSIVLLDACRNNPLSPEIDAIIADGLAVPETGRDTFVAFATQPGNLSFDGREGQNSPFTRALLRHLGTEGQPISELMIAVRNEVEAATSGQQIPWDQSSLTAPFFFNPFTPTDDDMADLAAMTEERRARTLRMWRAQGARVDEVEPLPELTLAAAPEPEELSFDLIILDEDLPEPETELDGALTLAALPEPDLAPADVGVTRALQQLSTSQIRATERSPLVPDAPIEWLASLGPALRGADNLTGRDRLIGEDVTPPGMNLPEMDARELAVALQTELQRLGCYRMTIDGAWGPGSRRALADYFERTDQRPLDTEPTREILVLAMASEGEICPAPVAAPRQQRQPQQQAAPRQQPAPAPQTQAAPQPQQAAPPSGGGGGGRLQSAIRNFR